MRIHCGADDDDDDGEIPSTGKRESREQKRAISIIKGI
jgi:hypothetical protein